MNTTSLVCLGDSITWGYPYGPQYSWVEISRKVLGLNMINRGINGDTSHDLGNRFNKDVLNLNPTHVLIMVGTNDVSIGVSLGEFTGFIQKMYSQAESHNIQVIMGLPIPSTDKWLEYGLEKYRHWLRSFASDQNLGLVDFSNVMKLDTSNINPDCYSDDVHPSLAGYQAMAGQFVEWAKKFFAYK